ncbi:spore coat protein [Paenibacillus xerothermodurans]|uniref:Spore coat protein n=1 Tax=Paenibacillus xerothermodurans TaxID=1977292 RepID=A0A2W1NAJ0_PAEXE|nr:spore coat protein [Paenibacillus xerothermodurans]PZE21679.1 spore coat protein [Paenibacillus xerothermodurans]
MNTVENKTAMQPLTDQVLATDLLFAAKTGIKSYALALSEAATPEVRQVLHDQLEETIAMHGRVTSYMMNKGWYHPYNANEQIMTDMKYAQSALNQRQT